MAQYTVKSGDSLSLISKKLTGSLSNWKTLYNLNINVIGNNPNKIKPGQVLNIPESWNKTIIPVSDIKTIATPSIIPQTSTNQNSIALEEGVLMEEKKPSLMPWILAGAAAWYFLG